MCKRLLFLLFLSCSSFAQYTSADFDLVSTTFERKFDRKILDKYVSSKLPANVNAALLSMSNAQDTALIPFILRPDYEKFGSLMAFALGETGPSPASESFLLEKILSGKFPDNQRHALEAIGRCGRIEAMNSISQEYFSNPAFDANGISVAIAAFNARGIKTADSFEVKVLIKELSDNKISINRKIDAAFAASRIGLNKNSKTDLVKLLFNSKNEDENSIVLKQYLIAALRKIRQIPDSPEQIRSLLAHNDWRIRTEAVKLMAVQPMKSPESLNYYFKSFNDKNPNVSRQAAMTLREMKIDSSLSFLLRDLLTRSLADNSLAPNTLGELFIDYCRFFPSDIFTMIDKLKGKVSSGFVFRALTENNVSPARKLNYLFNAASPSSRSEKLEHLTAVISLQKTFPENQQISDFLLSALSGSFPAGISVAADGLDSLILHRNLPEIRKIISRQIILYMNNTNFTESIMSLIALAKRISADYAGELLLSLKSSTSFSVQSFIARETGRPVKGLKQTNNLFDFWNNSFAFRSAKVNTEKGTFVIRFAPEYCPVSVGNFCKLASSGFFNNVVFHRVVPDFVIQTGDPDGTGWGGPGYDIISEFSPVPFDRSYVGMASAGKDTEGSQWFVMHSSFPHLNGRYSNFGRVTEGMNVVSQIDQGDKIISVELIK